MLRILRAFAWMRWRVLVNSLERTGARDTLERFSVAIEQVGPIITLALFFPTAMVLAALGFYAGYGMTSIESGGFAFTVFRYLLLTATALSILGPIMLPSAEQTDAVRLLLLPIPPRTLYVAQAAATVSDPWILLVTADGRDISGRSRARRRAGHRPGSAPVWRPRARHLHGAVVSDDDDRVPDRPGPAARRAGGVRVHPRPAVHRAAAEHAGCAAPPR